MTSLVERELQRGRWRRTLSAAALDCDNREDFATGGLASRLTNITTQILLLPTDPEADAITIDEVLATFLQSRQSIVLDRITVALPANARRTAHAVVIADSYTESWTSYLAIHRSGAVEFGLGDVGGWEGSDRNGNAVRLVTLTPVVARVWALLRLAAEIHEGHAITGPFQLTVGVRRTKAALLSTFGEGWAEPGSFENRTDPCPDEHLLWHLEFDDLPDHDGARQIAYRVGDRMEDAWGSRNRRYLAHRGDYEGELDARRVN